MADFIASGTGGRVLAMVGEEELRYEGEDDEGSSSKKTSLAGGLREVPINNHHNIPRESYGSWDDSQDDDPSDSP